MFATVYLNTLSKRLNLSNMPINNLLDKIAPI